MYLLLISLQLEHDDLWSLIRALLGNNPRQQTNKSYSLKCVIIRRLVLIHHCRITRVITRERQAYMTVYMYRGEWLVDV